ncbi:MAG: NAD(P)H-dependent oxidoreductase [Coriobacteriia bacterium]
MPKVTAICGSFRAGSYNQMLLNTLVERAPEGLEIVQADIRAFPVFNQDDESNQPQAVLDAKAVIQDSDCVLLVTPEYNFGVPGGLKNAIDWLSRPHGDATLNGRPLALAGASSGYMGTMRCQLQLRQSWHFFKAPVFAGAELTVAFADRAFDAERRLTNEGYIGMIDTYLAALKSWLDRKCASVV